MMYYFFGTKTIMPFSVLDQKEKLYEDRVLWSFTDFSFLVTFVFFCGVNHTDSWSLGRQFVPSLVLHNLSCPECLGPSQNHSTWGEPPRARICSYHFPLEQSNCRCGMRGHSCCPTSGASCRWEEVPIGGCCTSSLGIRCLAHCRLPYPRTEAIISAESC